MCYRDAKDGVCCALIVVVPGLFTMARRLFPLAFLAAICALLLWLFPDLRTQLEAPISLTKGIGATVELHQLQKFVLQRKILDGGFPNEAEFIRLVESSLRSKLKNPRLDFWQTPYGYQRTAQGFMLASAGPDRAFSTRDDLVLVYKE